MCEGTTEASAALGGGMSGHWGTLWGATGVPHTVDGHWCIHRGGCPQSDANVRSGGYEWKATVTATVYWRGMEYPIGAAWSIRF